jgi:biopolymer transport protein ExbD
MKFSNRKRRQAPTIIIISLIDILIVLLIFLMVTTSFKQQPTLKLVLPESKFAKEGGSENLHNLLVTVAKQEPFFYIQKRPVTLDRLQQELTSTAAKDPNLSVMVWPDTGAPFGQVLKAWEAVRTAGVKNAQLAAKKPSEH